MAVMLSSLEPLETNMKRMCWNGIGSGWESALKNIDELNENNELKWPSLVETPTNDLFYLVSGKGLIYRCDTSYPAFASDGLEGGYGGQRGARMGNRQQFDDGYFPLTQRTNGTVPLKGDWLIVWKLSVFLSVASGRDFAPHVWI